MDELPARRPKGRGAVENPHNRFERLSIEPVPQERGAAAGEGEEPEGEDARRVPTEILRDASRSILSHNDSPDIPFDTSINPYRGCEHGCIYCYARPTHEYLGFSAGLDFETRILVKEGAATLLRKELAARSWTPRRVVMSGVTDPYQPIERKLEITRQCLAVCAELRQPVGIITKNELITRDLDLLGELHSHGAAGASISITTLDGDLARILEPRASHPRDRLKAVERLAAAGIPVSVMVAPIVPAITDHEIPAILEAAAAAGAWTAGYTVLRLPGAVAGLFEGWLAEHFPERKEKVLQRIRSMRGGELHDPRFGHRMRGDGIFAEQIRSTFHTFRRRFGLDRPYPELSTAAFRKPGEQLGLFGPG